MKTLIAALSMLAAGCATLAVATAPARTGTIADTPKKRQAVAAFWAASHAAAYDQIPAVSDQLTAAYFESPSDPELATLLGGLNTWRVAEFGRMPEQRVGTMQTSMFAAGQYWSDAMQLSPDAPLPAAFYAEMQLMRGAIFKDEKRKRDGYFILKDAAARHPAVNTFVLALALSRAPRGDPRLDESVAQFWVLLEKLAGPIDRKDPDLRSKLSQVTHTGTGRFLWGSEKVPHPFEGMFAIFGDVLVKNGNPELAKKIYAQAKVSPAYADWPFQADLDQQIATADQRSKDYPTGEIRPDEAAKYLPTMGRTCSTCHQSLAATAAR